jgi:hypothetical protein
VISGQRRNGSGLTRDGVLARQAAGAGGTASGSGDESRDPRSPRGEGNKRARTSISSTTTLAVCPRRPLINRTAMSGSELVEHFLSFLERGELPAHIACTANQCRPQRSSCARAPPKAVPAPLSWAGPPPVVWGPVGATPASSAAPGPVALSTYSASSKAYPWTAPPERTALRVSRTGHASEGKGGADRYRCWVPRP